VTTPHADKMKAHFHRMRCFSPEKLWPLLNADCIELKREGILWIAQFTILTCTKSNFKNLSKFLSYSYSKQLGNSGLNPLQYTSRTTKFNSSPHSHYSTPSSTKQISCPRASYRLNFSELQPPIFMSFLSYSSKNGNDAVHDIKMSRVRRNGDSFNSEVKYSPLYPNGASRIQRVDEKFNSKCTTLARVVSAKCCK
jgi:hypothetical protein